MTLPNPTILVVEDEPSQVELLRYNLTKQGYDVRVAMDGEEGLQAAIEDPPDLILLDWMLPNLSGVEVCRQLRRNRTTREIPIIMLTARSEERDKVRGLDIGADDYVTKPYSIKELAARIQAALRRPAASIAANILSFGGVEVDIQKHIVQCPRPCSTIARVKKPDQGWQEPDSHGARIRLLHEKRLTQKVNEIAVSGPVVKNLFGFLFAYHQNTSRII